MAVHNPFENIKTSVSEVRKFKMAESAIACQVETDNLFRIQGSAPSFDPNLQIKSSLQNLPESASDTVADLGILLPISTHMTVTVRVPWNLY